MNGKWFRLWLLFSLPMLAFVPYLLGWVSPRPSAVTVWQIAIGIYIPAWVALLFAALLDGIPLSVFHNGHGWLWLQYRLRKTPHHELAEQHALLIKTARRCAYDLWHAADTIPFRKDDVFGSEFYHRRAQHWLHIFAPDGTKNYRHKLHDDIERLTDENEKMRKLLAAHQIPLPEGVQDIPF